MNHTKSDDKQTMNIRRPMVFGNYDSPFDPNKPIILTCYVGFSNRGMSVREQAATARWNLLSRSYRDYEIVIRKHLNELFEQAGFDAKRDIAGIVLNRWGHSYVVPEPGFYFGRFRQPAPHEVLTKRTGRIAFGHSELNGVQEWFGGVENGTRAMQQVMEVV
jgi:spermidine dehydrogenase